MNYVKWQVTLNGTLILAYLMFIGSCASAIITKDPDCITETAIYVAALAGVRSLAGRISNGNNKDIDNSNHNCSNCPSN